MTTTKALAKAMANTMLIDDDLKLAAAMAGGETTVPGLSERRISESMCSLISMGHVETITQIPCPDHPEVEDDDYNGLCGVHRLRFGDVELDWSYCYLKEVLTFDEYRCELGLTAEEYTALLVDNGYLIEHLEGGYIPSPHPDIRDL